MDPRHQLYKSLDRLAVDPDNQNMSARTDSDAMEVQATSGVTAEAIREKLVRQLGATHVEIEDMSGMLFLI